MIGRRGTIASGVAAALLGPAALAARPTAVAGERFGLIGRMRAKPGQRAALTALLLDGTQDMPGCLSYIVAEDAAEADALWVTEVWDGEASHKASLKLPAVRAAIARAMPLVAGFDTIATTRPRGGVGLS